MKEEENLFLPPEFLARTEDQRAAEAAQLAREQDEARAKAEIAARETTERNKAAQRTDDLRIAMDHENYRRSGQTFAIATQLSKIAAQNLPHDLSVGKRRFLGMGKFVPEVVGWKLNEEEMYVHTGGFRLLSDSHIITGVLLDTNGSLYDYRRYGSPGSLPYEWSPRAQVKIGSSSEIEYIPVIHKNASLNLT